MHNDFDENSYDASLAEVVERFIVCRICTWTEVSEAGCMCTKCAADPEVNGEVANVA